MFLVTQMSDCDMKQFFHIFAHKLMPSKTDTSPFLYPSLAKGFSRFHRWNKWWKSKILVGVAKKLCLWNLGLALTQIASHILGKCEDAWQVWKLQDSRSFRTECQRLTIKSYGDTGYYVLCQKVDTVDAVVDVLC